MPTHTRTAAAANSGDGSSRPFSINSLYDIPIMTSDTVNSARDSGRLRSFISSCTLSAFIRSTSRVRDTERAFSSAARTKTAPNTAIA